MLKKFLHYSPLPAFILKAQLKFAFNDFEEALKIARICLKKAIILGAKAIND